MINKRINIPLYFHKLRIIQTDDFEEVHKHYRLKGEIDYSGVTIDAGYEIVVAFKNDVTPSLIAHEALHVCSIIFKNIKCNFDEDNDEPIAYLLGWIVEQIHKLIKVR
jgi:hypothetical protein